MSAQSPYREVFLAARALLQRHDPHGLMKMYTGNLFDDDIYGYEATTILERINYGYPPEEVETVFNSLA